MPKYVALQDVPPSVKKGDIVTIKEPLVPSYKDKFAPYSPAQAEETKPDADDGKTVVRNPDRNALKDRATELGINFAQNIPTERLIELIQEAESKQNAGGEGGEGGSDVEQPEGGSGGPEGSGTDPNDGASEE